MTKRRLLSAVAITLLLQGSLFAVQKGQQAKADALKMIDSAVASSANLDPSDRASVLFAAAHALRTTEPAKAQHLLQECYELLRPLTERDAPGIGFLNGEVVNESARQFPDFVEQHLPREGRLKNLALLEIIKSRIVKKDIPRAVDLLNKMDTEPELELAAEQILKSSPSLKKESAGSILGTVLIIHRRISSKENTALFPEDLGTLVVRYWRDIQPSLATEIIDTLLADSSPGSSPGAQSMPMVVKGNNATVTLDNTYLYRVLQFLPILNEIDPAEAKALAEKNGVALDQLQAAASSISPPKDSGVAKQDVAAGDVGKIANSFDEDRKIEEVANLSLTSPKEAFRIASGVSDLPSQIRILIAIARVNGTDGQETALEALAKAAAVPIKNDTDARGQWRLWKEGAELSLNLKNVELTTKFVSRGLASADGISKRDLQKDDPNLAPTLYWPSVHAYRDFYLILSQVSTNESQAEVEKLSNERIKPLEVIFLANALIGNPVWASTSPMVLHRKDVRAQ